MTSGCDVTVNLKRVCDESSTVLDGIGELMAGVAKIQAELAKGKTCVEVKERIEQLLTKGDTMLTLFNQAMEPIKRIELCRCPSLSSGLFERTELCRFPRISGDGIEQVLLFG